MNKTTQTTNTKSSKGENTMTKRKETPKQLLRRVLEAFNVTMTDTEYKRTTKATMDTMLIEARAAYALELAMEERAIKARASKIDHNISGKTVVDHSLTIDGTSYDVWGSTTTAEELVRTLAEEPMIHEKKKEQILIRQTSIKAISYSKGLQAYTIADPEHKVESFKTSESRLLRYDNEMVEVDGNLVKSASNMMIVDCSDTKDLDDPGLVTSIVYNGFKYDGKTWVPALRSASQSRTYKMIFTALNGKDVRTDTSYGANFSDKKGMVNPAKKDSRYGNCNSSSKNVGKDFTYAVIEDRTYERTMDVRTWDGTNDVKQEEKTLTLTPGDGQGFVSPQTCAKLAFRYGLINKGAYTYFLKNFTSLDDLYVSDDNRLHKIFKMIPKGWQLRPAGIKGFVVMYDIAKHGFDVDFVFTDSMVKYAPADINMDIDFEILQYSKVSKGFTSTNYQMLQALNIDSDTMLEMGKKAIARVTDDNYGILNNADAAKKFLGLMSSMTAENDVTDSLLSKVMVAIDANPGVITDSYIQAKLRRLVRNYLTEISIARMPIEGQYAYIVSDPDWVMTGKSSLQENEFYYNNEVAKWTITRSPLVHRSEVVRMETVEVPTYWYLNDVLIFNPFGDTLPRMGGADTDGDKVCMTKDETIMNAEYNEVMPMLYDAGFEGVKMKDTEENLLEFWSKNMARPQGKASANIGTITNFSTIWNDIALQNGDVKMSDDKVMILRFLQGWTIDAAKTNMQVTVPEALSTKMIPDWLVFNNSLKGYGIKKDAIVYPSMSPIGILHRYVLAEIEKLNTVTKQSMMNSTTIFINGVCKEEVPGLYHIIADYEKSYRMELADLGEKVTNNYVDEELAEQMRIDIYDKYTHLMDCVEGDEATKAGIAYEISYNGTSSQSVSFPWITSFRGLMMLLQRNFKNRRLYKLPKAYAMDTTIEDLVVYGNEIIIDVDTVGMVDPELIPDDYYKVERIMGVNYIAVESDNVNDYNGIYEALNGNKERTEDIGKRTMFTVTGFKYVTQTAQTFVEALKANNNVADLLVVDDRVAVMVDGVRYGVVAKTEAFNPIFFNTRVEVLGHDHYLYVSKNTGEERMTGALQHVHVELIEGLSLEEVAQESSDVVVSDYETSTVNDDSAFVSGEYYDPMIIQGSSPVVLEPVAELDPVIMEKVNTDKPYWSNPTLVEPNGIASSEVIVVNTAPIKGQVSTLISEVTVVANSGGTYKFNVIFTNGDLQLVSLDGTTSVSADFASWSFRATSYKAASIRIRNNA